MFNDFLKTSPKFTRSRKPSQIVDKPLTVCFHAIPSTLSPLLFVISMSAPFLKSVSLTLVFSEGKRKFTLKIFSSFEKVISVFQRDIL